MDENKETLGKYDFCWLCGHPMNDTVTACTNANCPNSRPLPEDLPNVTRESDVQQNETTA